MNEVNLVQWALDFAFACVGLAMCLAALRLLRGPLPADRVLALDTLYVTAVALAVLLGLRHGTALYFADAMLVALLGFVSTVALARYLCRGDVVE